MPTRILLNGKSVYTPGVYGDIRAGVGSRSEPGFGGIALVGDFPGFEQSVPSVFFNASGVEDYDRASAELSLLASLAFNPSRDDDVSGADTLTIVSSATTSAASFDVLDTNSDAALTLTSRVWGVAGNRLAFTAARDGTTTTWVVTRDGITENIVIEAPVPATLQYAGVATSADFTWDADGLRFGWTRSLAAKPNAAPQTVATDWDECPTAGVLGVLLSLGDADAHDDDVTVEITGTTLAGVAQVVTLTFGVGTTLLTTAETWGSVTSVTVSSDDADWRGITSFACPDGRVISPTGRKISGVVAEMGLVPGITATVLDPTARQLDAADADFTDGTIDATALYSISANMALTVTAFNSSKLASAARGAAGLDADLSADLSESLAGGSETSPVGTTDWQAALDAVADQDVQIVTCLSSDSAVHALLADHCNDSALQGYERNYWAGIASDQTKAQYQAAVNALNTRYGSLVGDKIKVQHPNGTTPTLAPPYLALMMAGMQAGTSAAVPLTDKRPNILDAYQTWRPNLDGEEMIRNCAAILSQDNLGWYLRRDITTHIEDDNIYYSERSVWEALQTAVRTTRAYISGKGVQPKVTGYKVLLKNKAMESLDKQVTFGTHITAWRNLTIVDVGDVSTIKVEIAPVFPANFIVIQITPFGA